MTTTDTLTADPLDDADEACELCEEVGSHHPECITCPGTCGERTWAEHGACSQECANAAMAEARADRNGRL